MLSKLKELGNTVLGQLVIQELLRLLGLVQCLADTDAACWLSFSHEHSGNLGCPRTTSRWSKTQIRVVASPHDNEKFDGCKECQCVM